MSYTKKRYIGYILITLFVMGLPFITIDGKHMLLLSFVNLEFHFLGFSFDVNELFVMPFLLMFLFIGIFAMTSMFGRVWCGWACPQTIFRVIYRDLIESTILDLRRIKNKQKDIDYSKKGNQIKKYLGLALWMIITILIASNFMWYFVSPEDFFAYIQDPLEHTVLILFILSIAMFLFYDIVFMKENFCMYVCPYSRIQSVLYDDNTKQVVYDTNRGGEIYKSGIKTIFNANQLNSFNDCTACEACVKVCPTHIDIRKGLQVECINCLECSDACDTVMTELNKENLIQWGSTNKIINKKNQSIWTKRNIAYFISLFITVIFAISMMVDKQYFIVNINKTTELYKIKDDNSVVNHYIFTIQNRENKTQEYYIEPVDNENFEISKFSSFQLNPNERVKKIITIKAKKRLFVSDSKDTTFTIKVKISTPDEPKKELIKELSFVYPKNSLFK